MSWKNIILSLLHLSTESRPFLVLIKLYQPVVFFSIMGAETFAIIIFFFSRLTLDIVVLVRSSMVRCSLSICL